mmetsp:Transcript_44390/g.74008  ORF Transcript_44390/g.74008 Transcript_44390/m.74008 type:complete len:808 (+) Transcript_44390:117-2540(+)
MTAKLEMGSGERLSQGASTVLQQFQYDPLLQVFLKPDFESTSYARSVLSESTATASNSTLASGIASLENELRAEVTSRHAELLQQVGSLQETENALGVVHNGVSSLQATVARIRAEIAEPYRQIKTRTRQLAALNETVDLLRRVLRMLKLVAKLRDQLSAAIPDLSKAAKLLSDVETLRAEGDLSGIDVLDVEDQWLASVSKNIRGKAEVLLKQGMQSLSQAEVGSVLQVYYNLNELGPAVSDLQAKYIQVLTGHMAVSLDPAKISAVSAAGGTGPGNGSARQPGRGAQAGGAQRWQHALWQQLASCMEALHTPIVAMWHLQRVLAKKRDPIMHVCFLDFLMEGLDEEEHSLGGMLSERVWSEVMHVLEATLNNAHSSGSGVKEALVLGYPRLAALLDATFARILKDTDVKGVPPAVHKDSLQQLYKAAEVFQIAYLGRTLQRLTEAVNGLFTLGGRGSSNVVAGAADVQKVVRLIKEELDSALPDARVTGLIASVAAKAIRILGEKCEYLIASGPDAHQVTATCSATQERNLQLCVLIQEFHSAVAGILGGLPTGAAEALKKALGEVDHVAYDCLTPLFKSIGERFEKSLVRMHQERMADDTTTTECSKYMENILKVVAYFNTEFLQQLTPNSGGLAGSRAQFQVASGLTQKAAQRVLELFVRHASLVRPLSEVSKLRLAKDMAELELAVGQNLFPVEQLGASYRALRAFRPLLFLDTAQVLGSPLLKELPTSVVLHHMYARAPAELVSPHTRADLTAAQYSLWLDQHSEEEVWRGVKGTLDAYTQANKGLPLHEVHGIMLALGSR